MVRPVNQCWTEIPLSRRAPPWSPVCVSSILSSIQCPTRSSPASATFTRAIRLQAPDHSSLDSLLEGDGFELVWGFSCQAVVFGLFWFVLVCFGLFWFVLVL